MRILMEIRSNYWPNTPLLRELKIYLNHEVQISCFCDKEQIQKMIKSLQLAYDDMKDVCKDD